MKPVRALLTTGTALAALVGVFGYDAIRSHFSATRDGVGSALRGATPDAYEYNRIKALIDDKSRRVLAFRDKISDMGARLDAERKEVETLASRLGTDRAALASEREMLKQSATTFDIQGTSYTRTQVESSALARLSRCNRHEAQLETKRKVIAQLEVAVREGQGHLQSAMAARDEDIRQLDILKIRLENAGLQKELADLAAPLREGVDLGKGGELQESFKAYEDRVKSLERDGEMRVQNTAEPVIIPHQAGEGQGGLLEQMDRYLAAPAAGS